MAAAEPAMSTTGEPVEAVPDRATGGRSGEEAELLAVLERSLAETLRDAAG